MNWDSISDVQREMHKHTSDLGYWDDEAMGDKIAHLHSEVTELYEAMRKGPTEPCDKWPRVDLTREQEEFADILLVLLDIAGYRGVDMADAARRKFEFNKGRGRISLIPEVGRGGAA